MVIVVLRLEVNRKAAIEGFLYSTDYLCERKKMKVSVGYCEYCCECGIKGMAGRPLRAYNYEFSGNKAVN